jgi:hypothetical protein
LLDLVVNDPKLFGSFTKRWDINDYADLDQVFAGTEAHGETVCEAEILLETQEGTIETVGIALLDAEQLTVLAHHRYTILRRTDAR